MMYNLYIDLIYLILPAGKNQTMCFLELFCSAVNILAKKRMPCLDKELCDVMLNIHSSNCCFGTVIKYLLFLSGQKGLGFCVVPP